MNVLYIKLILFYEVAFKIACALSLNGHDTYTFRKWTGAIDYFHNIHDSSMNVQELMHVMYSMHCSFIQPLSIYITLTSILYVLLLTD